MNQNKLGANHDVGWYDTIRLVEAQHCKKLVEMNVI
jgi:hypothetical protein